MESYLHSKISIVFLLFCYVHTTLASKAPAMYIFGDSLADVGTNNHFVTIVKADFAHHGVDFFGGIATGRFSNGKNAVDFMADKLGLPSPFPYLSISKHPNKTQEFLNGINFASGGAGVLKFTYFGLCVSFEKQIKQLAEVKKHLVQQLGSEKAQSHLSKSIYSIVIGSNDVLGYMGGIHVGKTPEKLVNEMTTAFQGHLKSMYEIGARKFAVVGTAPIGCCPTLRLKNGTGDCNTQANYISDLFARESASLLNHMKTEHTDMSYSFFNCSAAISPLIYDPLNYGFTEVKSGCCGRGKLNAKVACYPISTLCSNRSDHVFWDAYHPSERASKLIIDSYYEGSSPHVYPINLKALGEL